MVIQQTKTINSFTGLVIPFKKRLYFYNKKLWFKKEEFKLVIKDNITKKDVHWKINLILN